MVRISSICKYLDQPLLTAKINKNVPAFFALASATVIATQAKHTPKEERNKKVLKTSIILAATAVSAIFAPRIASFITKRGTVPNIEKIKKGNSEIIDKYIKEKNINQEIRNILKKAKNSVLTPSEIEKLNTKEHYSLTNKLIPPPENIQAKDIFKEIGYLSVFGAVPVLGGILGGITADKFMENDWKSRIPNKINEGLYQYLANIFLCNIGAGLALGGLEKMSIKSKSARCVGMIGGIILTGVIGGSAIANYISQKIVNPTLSKDASQETRTPELLDIGLHTDDIATVSLLSGLKWIEPALPILYSISGYRAGIGYRNKKEC